MFGQPQQQHQQWVGPQPGPDTSSFGPTGYPATALQHLQQQLQNLPQLQQQQLQTLPQPRQQQPQILNSSCKNRQAVIGKGQAQPAFLSLLLPPTGNSSSSTRRMDTSGVAWVSQSNTQVLPLVGQLHPQLRLQQQHPEQRQGLQSSQTQHLWPIFNQQQSEGVAGKSVPAPRHQRGDGLESFDCIPHAAEHTAHKRRKVGQVQLPPLGDGGIGAAAAATRVHGAAAAAAAATGARGGAVAAAARVSGAAGAASDRAHSQQQNHPVHAQYAPRGTTALEHIVAPTKLLATQQNVEGLDQMIKVNPQQMVHSAVANQQSVVPTSISQQPKIPVGQKALLGALRQYINSWKCHHIELGVAGKHLKLPHDSSTLCGDCNECSQIRKLYHLLDSVPASKLPMWQQSQMREQLNWYKELAVQGTVPSSYQPEVAVEFLTLALGQDKLAKTGRPRKASNGSSAGRPNASTAGDVAATIVSDSGTESVAAAASFDGDRNSAGLSSAWQKTAETARPGALQRHQALSWEGMQQLQHQQQQQLLPGEGVQQQQQQQQQMLPGEGVQQQQQQQMLPGKGEQQQQQQQLLPGEGVQQQQQQQQQLLPGEGVQQQQQQQQLLPGEGVQQQQQHQAQQLPQPSSPQHKQRPQLPVSAGLRLPVQTPSQPQPQGDSLHDGAPGLTAVSPTAISIGATAAVASQSSLLGTVRVTAPGSGLLSMMATKKDVADWLWREDEAGGAEVDRFPEDVADWLCWEALRDQQAHQLELHLMSHSLYSPDPNQQCEAAQWFRKLLVTDNPPIEEVIKQNFIPQFVKFLERTDMPQLQFEAACMLTKVASGKSEHTKVVIDAGAVPNFVQLLASPSDDVREQAVSALGNVAIKCRDVVLNAGALPPLLKQLEQGSKLSILRKATLTLLIFCGGKPPPDFQLICNALPTLARLIDGNDGKVLEDACLALNRLSDSDDCEHIGKIIEAGVCRRLVELLLHSSPVVVKAALYTISNLVASIDMHTQEVVDCGALNGLLRVLLTANQNKSIKEVVCRTISNITAGTNEQIQAVIDAGIIPALLELLQNAEIQFDIKEEAVWAISNATIGGTAEQVKYLVDVGAIKALCNVLPDVRIDVLPSVPLAAKALDGLEHILKVGEQMKDLPGSDNVNPFQQLLKDADGLEKIETLLENSLYFEELQKRAMSILETLGVRYSETYFERVRRG